MSEPVPDGFDLDAARRLLSSYDNVPPDEWEILAALSVDRIVGCLHTAAADLRGAVNEVIALRRRVSALDAERVEMTRAFTDPTVLAAYQASAASWERTKREPERMAWLREEEARLDARLGGGEVTTRRPVITCDPRVQFGRACVSGTRVTADTVAEYVWAGESPEEVTRDFGITRLDVLWCCAWWVENGHRSRMPRQERWELWRAWSVHAGLVLGGHRPGVDLCDPDDYKPALEGN